MTALPATQPRALGEPKCDVTHCDRARPHNGRLCVRCETRLPATLRVSIIAANDEHRRKDWRAACATASDYLGLRPRDPAPSVGASPAPRPPSPVRPTVSPEASYEMTARRLGETD